MCGFIGAIALASDRPRLTPHPLEAALIGARGPDEQHEFGDAVSTVRFHRLALIGGSRRLSQLLYPRDISYCLLNGTLHGLAETYATDTDHEALAHHFSRHGLRGLMDLDGGFAICIKTRNTLHLATDAVGEKSLYWTRHDEQLHFSTSSRLLAAVLGRAPRGGPAIAQHLVLRGLPIGASYFEGIAQLPPGTVLSVHAGRVVQHRWWSGRPANTTPARDPHAIADAIAGRMRDGRCAVALSGGIDSSALTCIGYHHAGVRTAITIHRPDDADFLRDAAHARELAAHLHGLQLENAQPAGIQAVVRDFPVLDQDEFGLDGIATRASELGFNVLATGDAADELFCGYDRIFRFANTLSGPLSHPPAHAKFLARYAYTPVDWLCMHLPEADATRLRHVLSAYLATVADALDPLQGARRWFLDHHLFWLLRKADFACGRHGIESRAPFLHHSVTAFADALDASQLLPGEAAPVVKAPLKKLIAAAVPGCVPASIQNRTKQPFPIAGDMAEHAYSRTLSASALERAPPGIPGALHDALLDSPPGNDTRLRYLAYLSWKETCLDLPT